VDRATLRVVWTANSSRPGPHLMETRDSRCTTLLAKVSFDPGDHVDPAPMLASEVHRLHAADVTRENTV
jgi:hypothetical protein